MSHVTWAVYDMTSSVHGMQHRQKQFGFGQAN